MFDEQYVMDYPDLLIRGVLTGSCFLELDGHCTIAGSSGARSIIKFIPNPWFGKHNQIKGTINKNEKECYYLSGRWSNKSFYTKTGENAKALLFDADAGVITERKTAPLNEQQGIESHRLWGPVTKALKTKYFVVANAEKSRIENWQRRVRKERELDAEEQFKTMLFTFIKDSEATDEYSKRSVSLLSSIAGKPLLNDGAWIYSESNQGNVENC